LPASNVDDSEANGDFPSPEAAEDMRECKRIAGAEATRIGWSKGNEYAMTS